MGKFKLVSAMVIAASCVFTSQLALAYGAGDFFVRGGFAKTDVTTDNISDENGFILGAGYLFHDKLGVELFTSEKIEHDFGLAGNRLGTIDRMPVNLFVNYYPLGGLNPRVQPYAGIGINYTRFSGEDTPGRNIDVDDDYGFAAQAGVDLNLVGNLWLNGFATYADIDAEAEQDGNDIGTVKINPVTVGAAVTYSF